MCTEIAHSDRFVDAFVNEDVLHVLMSKAVTDNLGSHPKVDEFLSQQCTSQIGVMLIRDEEWVWEAYTHEMRRVYASCPGSSVDHDCVRVGELVG